MRTERASIRRRLRPPSRQSPLASRRRSGSRGCRARPESRRDRKSTRLNSSHANISYAVFCLKKNSQQLFQPGLGVEKTEVGRICCVRRLESCTGTVRVDSDKPRLNTAAIEKTATFLSLLLF